MNVQLDPNDEKELEELARSQGKNPGELLGELVRRAIAEQKRNGQGKRPPVDLMRYRGLGREIWEGEDAQEYVNRLREEWR